MPTQKLTKEAQELRKRFFSEMLKLVTSGFGLVAALAWNELIKEVISKHIEPVFGGGSSLISLLIYAVVVTLLAVTVTYKLSKFSKNEED